MGGAAVLNLSGAANEFAFTTTLAVVAGDTLDFAVGNGGNGYNVDSTGVFANFCHEAAVMPAR
jgi:hypothetical protein